MKKKLLTLLIAGIAIAAVVFTAAPLAAFAVEPAADDVVVTVYDEPGFKAAIRDKTTTFIKLGADITLKKNDSTYTINPNKPRLVIDGSVVTTDPAITGPDLRGFAIYENPANSGVGCAQIAVRDSKVKFNKIIVQNINLYGSQELGIIHVACDCGNKVNVEFDNVYYEGPALAVAYGAVSSNSVTVRDSDILLNPARSKCNRASEAVVARYIYIEGNVKIDKINSTDKDDYNEIFRLLYQGSKLYVRAGATLDIVNNSNPATHTSRTQSQKSTEYSGFIGTSVSSCDTSSVIFEDGSTTTYKGYGVVVEDLGRVDSCLAQLYLVDVRADANLIINTSSSGITKAYDKAYFHNSFFDCKEFKFGDTSTFIYTYAGDMNKGEKLLSFNSLTTATNTLFVVAAPDNTKAETVVALQAKGASIEFDDPYRVIVYNGKTTGVSNAIINEYASGEQAFKVYADRIKLWDTAAAQDVTLELDYYNYTADVYDTDGVDTFRMWKGDTTYTYAAKLAKYTSKTGGATLVSPSVNAGATFVNGIDPVKGTDGKGANAINTLYNRNILEINGDAHNGGVIS
ncbi:MAG: hypothetical protein LBL49_01435 [Clostridiales Family XIII bacterium]|jgi:hypothetical protein|nr:hypothetical protein [Clostridiales Family XIII bacterium]